MAPEQTRGGAIDHRADLFSLGCVLYRMITGRLPFKGTDTLSILASLALDHPTPPLDINPSIPAALSNLVMQLLAKNPDDRPASAHGVVEALEAIEQEQAADADVRDALQSSRPAARPSLKNEVLPTEKLSEEGSSSSPRGPSRSRWVPVAAGICVALLGIGCYLFGPAVYRIATNQGELVIETVDPDVEVTIKQGGEIVKIIDPKTQHEIILKGGSYRVELPLAMRDHLELSTDHFTLDRNGKVIVTVALIPPTMHKSEPGELGSKSRPGLVHGFAPSDKPLTQDGVTTDQGGWRIETKEKRTVRLFEVANPGVENCLVMYRAQMKTADLTGQAYLEMWCRFPGKGEYFSKGFANAVQGTTDWASYEIPVRLEKGQPPDLVKLNVAIEGKGTVWIKDLELLRNPLPGE